MARFAAGDASGSFTGLSETPVVNTDATGNFSFTGAEKYDPAYPANAQATAIVAGASVAAMVDAKVTSVVVSATGVLTVSGYAAGTQGISVAGVGVLNVRAALTSPVPVQIMIVGRQLPG